ncbi:MAG: hydroxymethylbilane synthase [Candidatus Limnocylindria bacterium]
MTSTGTLRIGSRGSRLARAQTDLAMAALRATGLDGPMEVVEISTRGDAISARRPSGGWESTDGQFTSELERALLDGRVDVVVHSYKDLPTAPTPGLVIAAVLERGDPRDCLLTRHEGGLEGLPFGARVATSSPRRAAQLAAARPDLVTCPIRGNVESRLARLERGEFDAVMLAAAGLDRLGLPISPEARLRLDLVLPAPAQAALAVQARSHDETLLAALAAADHAPTRIAVEAERALLRRIGGGCLAPLGTFGEVHDGLLRLRAAYEARDGWFVRAEASGPAADAAAVVEAAAARTLDAIGAPA